MSLENKTIFQRLVSGRSQQVKIELDGTGVFSWKEKAGAQRKEAQTFHRTSVKQQQLSSSKRQGPTLVPGDFLLRSTGIHRPLAFG